MITHMGPETHTGHEISETPLLDRLPSSVSIRVEVGRLCCEQRGRRPAEFRILSLVAGGPVPQEGDGLGPARTSGSEVAYGTKAPMKRRRAWRTRWSRKSDFASFWLNYILAIVCQT